MTDAVNETIVPAKIPEAKRLAQHILPRGDLVFAHSAVVYPVSLDDIAEVTATGFDRFASSRDVGHTVNVYAPASQCEHVDSVSDLAGQSQEETILPI